MEPSVLIVGIIGLLFLLLIVGAPFKPLKWLGSILMKVIIGSVLLFFVNAFGTSFGLHIPINLFTSSIAGLLGLPGLTALVIIKTMILS